MPEVPLHLPGGGRARAVLSGGPLRQVQVRVDGIAVGKCALPHLLHYRITTICETCGQLMEGASVHYHSIHYRCDVTSIAMNGVSSLTLSPPTRGPVSGVSWATVRAKYAAGDVSMPGLLYSERALSILSMSLVREGILPGGKRCLLCQNSPMVRHEKSKKNNNTCRPHMCSQHASHPARFAIRANCTAYTTADTQHEGTFLLPTRPGTTGSSTSSW